MAHPLVNDIAMKLEDESLLSAYIDGQLDPDQHQAVELALSSNPQLAEQVRALTNVRDLVGGLSRDASVDVSSVVLERIRPKRGRLLRMPVTIPRPARGRRVRHAAGLLVIAASMLIVFKVALNVSPVMPRQNSRSTTDPIDKTIMSQQRAPFSPSPIRLLPDSDSPKSASSSPSSLKSAGDAPGTVKNSDIPGTIATNDTNDVADPRDLEHVRMLLDSPPKLQRFFLVRDGGNGAARQHVANLVADNTRFGFYQITIAHGIVIDPRHPEEATVFAVVVSPTDFDKLKKQLNAVLPDAIEETPVDPQIVTQLADISQVQVSPALPGVMIPKDSVALRTNGADGRENATGAIQTTDARPTAEQEQSAPVSVDRNPKTDHSSGSEIVKRAEMPASRPGQSPEPSPGNVVAPVASQSPKRGQSPEKAEELIVVLIWVTKSQSG
jgi:hypothetical protein